MDRHRDVQRVTGGLANREASKIRNDCGPRFHRDCKEHSDGRNKNTSGPYAAGGWWRSGLASQTRWRVGRPSGREDATPWERHGELCCVVRSPTANQRGGRLPCCSSGPPPAIEICRLGPLARHSQSCGKGRSGRDGSSSMTCADSGETYRLQIFTRKLVPAGDGRTVVPFAPAGKKERLTGGSERSAAQRNGGT